MDGVIPVGWIYLPVAFALGALHALEPGHGKSLASAYLVGEGRSWKDAVVLGLATTFSHTAVVVLLAAASLWLKSYFSQGQLLNGLSFFGASALLALGAWVAVRSLGEIRHGHSHGHEHGHTHHSPRAGGHAGLWGVAVLGLGNGILPCPGALAALLVAVSMGRAAMGLITVLAYSLGLAVALASMGILVVEAGKRARAWMPSDKALLWLPLASGLLVFASGVWMMRVAIA
jgi:nickel/cobalt exporter